MLSSWLQGNLEPFRRDHWGKLPFALPGTARDVIDRCRWTTLHRILGRADDVILAEKGREARGAVPTDADSLTECFARGHGLVVRRAEHHDEGLAELARAIGHELPGEVHIQLFATPAGGRMFGWHFDTEDVIVVQTEGIKEYLLRRNTVCPESRFDPAPDFGRIREEQSDVFGATLLAGDWLHIPSPWWHIAEAKEDSLHVSIGVLDRPPDKPRVRRFRRFR